MASSTVPGAFVGSTPPGKPVRDFLGALSDREPCHYISWRLALNAGEKTNRGDFNLAAVYYIPSTGNTNLSKAGPRLRLRGTWERLASSRSVVYRIVNEHGRALSFAKLDDGLLHLLDENESLAVGNGGWSYTLNAAEHAERIVEPSVAATVPDMSYTIAPMSTGPSVFAVFEGRTPCHGIARELNKPQHEGCTKAKWRVTLYQQPGTAEPSTYKVEGTLFRTTRREGTWKVGRGTSIDSAAMVYELAGSGAEPPLLLWKVDRDVLFFLNQARSPLIGNAEFSYTLNRAKPRL